MERKPVLAARQRVLGADPGDGIVAGTDGGEHAQPQDESRG
jgi:hypothetical protein